MTFKVHIATHPSFSTSFDKWLKCLSSFHIHHALTDLNTNLNTCLRFLKTEISLNLNELLKWFEFRGLIRVAVILKYVQNAAGRGQTAIHSNLGNPSPFVFTPLQWVRVSTKSIMGIPKDWLCINLWFGSCFLCVVSFLGIWEGGLFRFCFCIFYGWGINVFGTKDILVYYELGTVELGGWKYRHIANFRCFTFYIYAIVHGLLSIMQWHSHPHSPLQEYKKKIIKNGKFGKAFLAHYWILS